MLGLDTISFLKKCSKNRKFANFFYKKFPFFEISNAEFLEKCYTLQRCGAGIVIGYVKDGYTAIIADADMLADGIYKNIPLGRFGEIFFKKNTDAEFTSTVHYGFFDQRGRVWCCGPIDRTVEIDDKKYFPFCIEPLFERIWWVKRAVFSQNCATSCSPTIRIFPSILALPIVVLFKRKFATYILNYAKKYPVTSCIENVVFGY